jgi:predicted permease
VLNQTPVTVIGVMPPGFAGEVVGRPTDLWLPIGLQPRVNPGRAALDRWEVSWLLLLGRRQPGVTLEQARAAVNVLALQILEAEVGGAITPELLPGPDARIAVTPGATGFSPFRPQFSQPLLTLMAIVGLVLLVACANVANLLLERAMGRQKEIAARLALGAGQARLLRQLLTESLLLAGLGGGLGVLFALWAGPALLRLAGGSVGIGLDLKPDLSVLAFTAAVALLTGVLFGLAPARRATRVELAPTLKESARSIAGAGGAGRWPLGKLLVVGQFALSLLLLTGAGLFLRSLQNLQRLDLGYDRQSVVILRLDPVAAGYPDRRAAETFPLEMLERLRALPGVTAATWSENGLFSGTESDALVRIDGFAPADGMPTASIVYDRVGPGYFEAVGIPLRAGRGIIGRDRLGAPRVTVINEALARLCFPDRNPLGRRLVVTGPPDVEYEIVGVSRDVRDHQLRGEVPPRFYLSARQFEQPVSAYNFEVRTATPETLLAPLRQTARAYDPDLPILELQPVGGLIESSINHEMLIARLSAIFGGLALLLASIGLYGVVSYSIARRTHEIGIRLALGAGRRGVLAMVLRETLLLALAGIALGIPAALAAARLVESRLFGLDAFDPATLVAATGILLLVALVAGTIPGTRATRVAPTQALRYG